jgi:hypothetical protein
MHSIEDISDNIIITAPERVGLVCGEKRQVDFATVQNPNAPASREISLKAR